MKLKEKIAAFLVAALLTLVGFDLIAAPAVEILKVGRLAGHQIIANCLAKTGTTGLSSPYFTPLKLPIEVLLILAIYAIVSFVVVKMGSFGKKTRKLPKRKPDDRRPPLGQFQIPDSRVGL